MRDHTDLQVGLLSGFGSSHLRPPRLGLVHAPDISLGPNAVLVRDPHIPRIRCANERKEVVKPG